MAAVFLRLKRVIGHWQLKEQGRDYESKAWLTKAKNRGLLKDNEFNALNQDAETIGKMWLFLKVSG